MEPVTHPRYRGSKQTSSGSSVACFTGVGIYHISISGPEAVEKYLPEIAE